LNKNVLAVWFFVDRKGCFSKKWLFQKMVIPKNGYIEIVKHRITYSHHSRSTSKTKYFAIFKHPWVHPQLFIHAIM